MRYMKYTTIFSAIALALSLGGCGSDNDTYVAPEPAPAPAPTPDPVVYEFPVQAEKPAVYQHDDAGDILVANNGLSLYFFANDDKNDANCNGVDGDSPGSTTDQQSCAGIWPPLLASDDATEGDEFTFVTRDSGSKQWAYKGYPLYTFKDDSAQGDVFGDGVNGIWDLARLTPVAEDLDTQDKLYVGVGNVHSATSQGQVLNKFRGEFEGRSLYTFDADPVGDARCYEINGDGCINTWPPLLADGGAKPEYPLSVLTLSNGGRQWAYKTKPLYFFVGDSVQGDRNGDGVNMTWHLATNQPAHYRITDLGDVLSATGTIDALLPESEDSSTLTSQSVDRDQFTLYTFDNDDTNDSNCLGMCAVVWPAFLANEQDPDVGEFAKFERDDGLLQWAFNGQPLYFFRDDIEKKQTLGDGVNGVWHVIHKSPEAVSSVPVKMDDTAFGNSIVVDGEATVLINDGNGTFVAETDDYTGFQLYTFDVDEIGISNCNSDTCKSTWPALLASEDDVAEEPYSIIERQDGYNQWAINGMPLYLFIGDTAAGQQNGEEVNDVWWVARPSPMRAYEHPEKGLLFIAHGNLSPSVGKTAEQLIDLTLYTFDDDVAGSGESTCFGGCAQTWPPLYANSPSEAYGEYTIIERSENDGSQTYQWAYQGLPLYFFVSDAKLGDTFGDYPTWTISRP